MNARIGRAAGAGILIVVMMVHGMAPPLARAEPELTEAIPAYGDVIQSLPELFHLCFTEPVRVEDPEDWRFNVATPQGQALGIRIVFDSRGDCVDVYPGAPEEPPQGIWTFDWLVRAQADGSEGAGVVKFQLGELQPGETPLDKPDSGDSAKGGDDGASTALILAVVVGATLVIAGTAGFILSRMRRA